MHNGQARKRAAEFAAWLAGQDAGTLSFQPLNDTEFFRHALEKEAQFGRPRPLSIRIAGEEYRAGKPAFDRLNLRFTLASHNDSDLAPAPEVTVMAFEGASATFESADFGRIVAGDRVTIHADIELGETRTDFRIQCAVKSRDGAGLLTVVLDELNRVRLETAMTKVSKRYRELKDFFKYAKGA